MKEPIPNMRCKYVGICMFENMHHFMESSYGNSIDKVTKIAADNFRKRFKISGPQTVKVYDVYDFEGTQFNDDGKICGLNTETKLKLIATIEA